jgi:hypothetical protein
MTPLREAARRTRDELRLVTWRRDGEREVRRRFLARFGYPLDTAAPQTFTEKVATRLVAMHRRDGPDLTVFADKLAVRDYVAGAVGEAACPRLLWVGTNPRALPFAQLPARAVIKTTHGSGQVVLVDGPDHLDQAAVVASLQRWLSRNFYWQHREPQYLRIPARVVVEERVDDGERDGPLDYRCFCFHGEPALIMVDDHRHRRHVAYDPQWRRLDVAFRAGTAEPVPRPDDLDALLDTAARLAAPFDFVRVDLYRSDGRVRFGELTFTPRAGNQRWRPAEFDRELGARWRIAPLRA